MALNIVVLNGNLGKDPEVKVSQSGMTITRFSVAVKGNRKDENGEYKTNWINCIAFSKTAELIGNNVKKGDKLGIRGSLETGSYTSAEGKVVYTTDVIVQEIEFLTSKQQQPAQQQYQQPQQQFAQQNNQYPHQPLTNAQMTYQAPQQQYQQQQQQPQQGNFIQESDLPF